MTHKKLSSNILNMPKNNTIKHDKNVKNFKSVKKRVNIIDKRKTKRNQILKKIVTKFDKSKQLKKRLEYSNPLNDMKNSKTHKINLGEFKNLLVRTHENDKPPESAKKLEEIASGSYNTIYNDGGNKAWRINTQIIYDKKELEELYREGLLTIRLAGLEIAPKIYDYYFANYLDGFYCVQVSEYSKYGSLGYFMNQPKFVDKTIIKMAKETIQLYKRMGENEIFCIDVKPGNMIVTNDREDRLSIRIIDFDTGFCASKESEKNRKLETFLKELKVKTPSITPSQIKNGFLTFNLLQVAAMSKIYSDNPNTDLFAKLLVRNITSKDIKDATKIANLNVGSKKPIDTLIWYTTYNHEVFYEQNERIFNLGSNTWVNNDPETILGLLCLYVKFGIKKTNQILFKYTTFVVKEKYSDRLTISLNEGHEEGHVVYEYTGENGEKKTTHIPPKFYNTVFRLDVAEKYGLIPK